ncbi:MAG TPA: hypothetical protein VHF22_03045, partial [Planctomycetota bacterium]|nr:hypothetical protein [Planctomycetota bacterium]
DKPGKPHPPLEAAALVASKQARLVVASEAAKQQIDVAGGVRLREVDRTAPYVIEDENDVPAFYLLEPAPPAAGE